MVAENRKSVSSSPTAAPITLYSNSPEATDLGSNFVKIIPGKTIGAQYRSSEDLNANELDIEVLIELDELLDDEDAADSADQTVSSGFVTPTLSDISIVGREVKYDSANNPTVTVTFKVLNSSGGTLKAVNGRIEKI